MSSDNELDAMTDEQAAGHYYRHRDEIAREVGEPVDIEPARPLSWPDASPQCAAQSTMRSNWCRRRPPIDS